MRKFLFATLSLAGVFYFVLVEVGGPVDDATVITTASQPWAGSGARLAQPRVPEPLAPARVPQLAAPNSETRVTSGGFVGPTPPLPGERQDATAADPDERTAVLRQTADLNVSRLYEVLWQALEVDGLDDADFQAFVLATLEEQGHHAPGEVLAALVKTAPTAELCMSALRLLSEASQELSLDSFNRALDDPDPAIRQTALAFFDQMNANALLDAVTDAVLDRNRDVRLLAFSTMEDMYEFIPVWEAADRAVDDPDPQIRKRALELLTYGDRRLAIDRLELALGDPNPEINELAEALLAELEQVSS
jgi:hypothetical protein